MKEILILAIIYIVFLVLSLFLRKLMIRTSNWNVVLIILAYLIGINFYFDLMVKIHQISRDNGWYIEFGHGEIMLLELYVFSYVSAIVLIVNVFYRRCKSSSTI